MSPELDAALHAIEVDFGCLMPDGLRSGGVTPTTKKLRAAIEAEVAAEHGDKAMGDLKARHQELTEELSVVEREMTWLRRAIDHAMTLIPNPGIMTEEEETVKGSRA